MLIPILFYGNKIIVTKIREIGLAVGPTETQRLDFNKSSHIMSGFTSKLQGNIQLPLPKNSDSQ
jgi:hypothetical protein